MLSGADWTITIFLFLFLYHLLSWYKNEVLYVPLIKITINWSRDLWPHVILHEWIYTHTMQPTGMRVWYERKSYYGNWNHNNTIRPLTSNINWYRKFKHTWQPLSLHYADNITKGRWSCDLWPQNWLKWHAIQKILTCTWYHAYYGKSWSWHQWRYHCCRYGVREKHGSCTMSGMQSYRDQNLVCTYFVHS